MVEREMPHKSQAAKRFRKEISNLITCLDVMGFHEFISYLLF